MKLKYMWLEWTEEGLLLDPDLDRVLDPDLDREPLSPSLNNFGKGHPTREAAVKWFQECREKDSWRTPRELILMEVYRAD